MSLSSRRRPRSSAAVLAGLLGVVGGLPVLTATANAAQLSVVAVVASAAERAVTLVTEVSGARPGEPRPASFVVTNADERVPARAQPVVSDQLALGVVVDASGSGAGALPTMISGSTSLLLQLSPAGRSTVVADTSPPKVLAPLRRGPTDAVAALSSVRSAGTRRTSDALTAALRQLPTSTNVTRVVVLQTGAADAGGEAASALSERLRQAHTVLAVITPAGVARNYWSRVAQATGGVFVTAQPSSAMPAFDQVADALRRRFVVTSPLPEQLPSLMSVQVTLTGSTLVASALVPRVSQITPSAAAKSDIVDRGAATVSLVGLAILVGLLLVGGVGLWMMARRRPPDTEHSLDTLLGSTLGSPAAALAEPRASVQARARAAPPTRVQLPVSVQPPVAALPPAPAPRPVAAKPPVSARPPVVPTQPAAHAARPASAAESVGGRAITATSILAAQRRARAVGAAMRAAADAAAPIPRSATEPRNAAPPRDPEPQRGDRRSDD